MHASHHLGNTCTGTFFTFYLSLVSNPICGPFINACGTGYDIVVVVVKNVVPHAFDSFLVHFVKGVLLFNASFTSLKNFLKNQE